MTAVWQQILAVDARYNTYRAINHPHLRTLYIRRRIQLLRENAKTEQSDPNIRRNYLRVRNQLLSQKYGNPSIDQSIRSRSTSVRSSRVTLESLESPEHSNERTHRRMHSGGSFNKYHLPHEQTSTSDGLVPTWAAEASRALVGDSSLSENYAFAGMYHIFDNHTSAAIAVKFANDDPVRLATGSLDGTVAVYQLNPHPVITCILRHSTAVTDFCWSLSNDVILSVCLDGSARLWATSTGKCVRVIQDPLGGALHCCTFQPQNNNMVVIGNSKGYVQILNGSTGMPNKGGQGKTPGCVQCLAFDSSGKILWAGDDKGCISSFMFDVATGRLTKGKRKVVCQGHAITSIASRSWISREARDPSLLVNCAVNLLCLYKVLGSDGNLQLKKSFPVKHRAHPVKSSFCPLMSFRQGACVISGSEDMCVYFFDIERSAKQCVNKLQGHSAPVLDVCFNHNESLLASCDAMGMVFIWKREQRLV